MYDKGIMTVLINKPRYIILQDTNITETDWRIVCKKINRLFGLALNWYYRSSGYEVTGPYNE